jgi:hypothetical protein
LTPNLRHRLVRAMERKDHIDAFRAAALIGFAVRSW